MARFFGALILALVAVGAFADTPTPQPSASAQPATSARIEEIRKSIEQLPPEQQEKVLKNLHRWQALSPEERDYLRQQEREYWAWWDAAVARYPEDPRRQVLALFEAQLEIAMTNSCRGCALGNAAAEISDDEDELSTLVRAYKEKVRKRLQDMARAMDARDPERLGDALMLLLDGGYFTRLIFPLGSGPISAALPAVRALIDAHLPPHTR